MELIVKNLGQLKEARLDIRPLTVFVGPNHTNKTWTAYSLYGIIRNLSRLEFATQPSLGFVTGSALRSKVEAAADQLLKRLIEKPAAEVTTRMSRDELSRGLPATEVKPSLDTRGIGSVLGVPESKLAGASASIRLSDDEFENSVYSALEVVYKPSDLELECRFMRADGAQQTHPYIIRLSLQKRSAANGAPADGELVLREHLVRAVGILAHTVFDNAAILPAERDSLAERPAPHRERDA